MADAAYPIAWAPEKPMVALQAGATLADVMPAVTDVEPAVAADEAALRDVRADVAPRSDMRVSENRPHPGAPGYEPDPRAVVSPPEPAPR
jgi:hypothetical protein